MHHGATIRPSPHKPTTRPSECPQCGKGIPAKPAMRSGRPGGERWLTRCDRCGSAIYHD